MSKPEDIPDDVWDEAMHVAVEMEIHAAVGSRTDAKASIIASSIMAEREACAAVADSVRAERRKLQQEEEGSEEPETEDIAVLGGQAFIARVIAETIRKRGEA